MSAPSRTTLPAALTACTLLAGCLQQPPDDPPPPTPQAQQAATAMALPAAAAQPPTSAGNEDPALAAHMQTPEFRREYRTKQEQLQTEAEVQENAPWLGSTGLTEAQERSVPRYVRMELGQSLASADPVLAEDLQYIGHFAELDGTVYYWRIPDKAHAHGDTHAGPAYVYIRKDTAGVFYTDWGNRTPPG
ncbi:hypothetical protein [Comamonas sp.]|uniref:hypothetical protein n=1 Tax=Comamonas sp. TaxID=34028 RepID=UPI00289AE67D|nr:hypothetical protein [Comamonas sp.]